MAKPNTNRRTKLIEQRLQSQFPNSRAYQYNPASIRVRIIDDRFSRKSNPERESLVVPLLEELPEDLQADITILLLLAPDEAEGSMMNVEFENPSPSLL
jgi:stress-induced morphogen